MFKEKRGVINIVESVPETCVDHFKNTGANDNAIKSKQKLQITYAGPTNKTC